MNQKSNEPSYPKGRAPIRPELLAGKLAAIRNYEYPELLDQMTANPRLVETLWFLQAMSLRPGGLLKFVEELLAEFPERLGTPTMLEAKSENYRISEKLAVFYELPSGYRPYIKLGRDGVRGAILADMTAEEVAKMDASDRRAIESVVKEMDAASFRKICRRAALQQLPEYFTALCTEKGREFGEVESGEDKAESLLRAMADFDEDAVVRFAQKAKITPQPIPAGSVWFFHDVMGALVQFMDRSAVKVKQRLAMTEVAKLIFDRLDYALAEKVMVRIEGGSRFGKTEALSAWVDMRPGLARLVRVPCDNSMASFFKRIGEALGIDCSYGSNPSRLKERVEYIIQHSGLFLVLDEAHFLAPMNFTETTSPHRLNWVRTEVVDRHLPLAISVTPQAFKGAIDRFVKKTRYDMTQFFGREFLPCVLPEVLSEADLIAVARIHFPELGANALGYIANEARLSQNYLQAVEAIARRTRFLTSKRGGAVRLKDIETAVSEVLVRNTVSPDQGADAVQIDSQEVDSRTASASAERRVNEPLTPIARGIQPGVLGIANRGGSGPSSLRRVGTDRAERDLVPMEA
jgi:hypothetical protein